MEFLEFYMVRSQDGKWLRSKGYNAMGDNWVDDIKKAKVWNKIGPARAQVTFWSTSYPSYGVPEIVVLKATIHSVIDEKSRVEKAKQNKANARVRKADKLRQEEIRRANQKFERTQ